MRLGNPNGAAALRRAGKGGAPLRAAIARNADRHARDLAPVVADIRAGGATSLRAIAGGAERPRHADPARRALARLDGDEPARPARARGGAMRQSRLMSLVEAVDQRRRRAGRRGGDADRRVPDPRAAGVARAEREAGAGVHRRVDRAKLRHAKTVREISLTEFIQQRGRLVRRYSGHLRGSCGLIMTGITQGSRICILCIKIPFRPC